MVARMPAKDGAVVRFGDAGERRAFMERGKRISGPEKRNNCNKRGSRAENLGVKKIAYLSDVEH